MILPVGWNPFMTAQRPPYVYFQKNSLDWPEEANKAAFYAVHTKTGEITRLQADFDPQYPFLDRINMDENGNLLLVYLQKRYEQDFKAYQACGTVLESVLAK